MIPTAFSSDGGIIYDGFTVGSRTNVSQPGVSSQSPLNRASYGGPNNISPSSIATSEVCFQLSSFYFGCLLGDLNAEVTLPSQCTLVVEGFDQNESSTGAQNFTFTPDTPTTTNMHNAVVTDVKKASVVRFTTLVAGVNAQAARVAVFDNVAYTQYDHAPYCGAGSWRN